MSMHRHSALALAACLLFAGSAQAEDKAASKDRELLRRAQAALRAEQEQRGSLEREKGTLSQEKQKLQEDVKRQGSQLAAAQGQARKSSIQLDQARSEAEQLKSQLESQQSANAQEQTALRQQVEQLRRQLSQTQQVLAERTQANQTLVSLLERSTQALSDAETKNRELYAAGLKAVQAYRQKGVVSALAQREPVFGFGSVQVENIAEDLRTQIDAQRVPSAFKPQ
jgi:DNA repair exonuclease SbcCD ATPase subunit